MSITRPLRPSDFKDKYSIVTATYIGNSRYLVKGEKYRVTRTNNPGLVSVQLTFNQKLRMSNGGVRFGISTFLVEEEESMINFEDLSVEDQERLLLQAREKIEQENLQRNAADTYKIKKKDLMSNTLEDIYKVMDIHLDSDTVRSTRQTEQYRNAIKTRYVSMVHYLFKANVSGKQHVTDNLVITTAFEWDRFVKINGIIKDAVIAAYTAQ